jgi:hypothetical protein
VASLDDKHRAIILQRSEQLRQLFTELAESEPLWSKDAAELFGVSDSYIRRLAGRRKIGIKIGQAWIVSGAKLRLILSR